MDGYGKIIVEIEGERKEFTLYFARQAVEEFARRLAAHLTDNSFKLLTDMVYAGLANFHTKMDLPHMPYHEVYALMETFAEQEDYEKQYADIQEAFWSSKHGQKYQEAIAETKKKVEQEMAALTRPETAVEKPTKPRPQKKPRSTGTTSKDIA